MRPPRAAPESSSDRRKLADLVDGRARGLEARVSEMERDFAVKLMRLETIATRQEMMEKTESDEGATWLRRIFAAFVINLLLHVATFMWLAIDTARISTLHEKVEKFAPDALSAMERSVERFTRLESEVRALRVDLEKRLDKK